MLLHTSAYNEIELTTEINMASSHRLIQMLLDKCIYHINCAKKYIDNNDLQKRNYALTKANDIVMHLRACLNFDEKTQEMAGLLDANYQYVERCLLSATLKNETKSLDLALIVFNNIKSGWDEMKL